MKYSKTVFTEILAIIFVIFSFGVFTLVMFHEVKTDSATTISIVECLKGLIFLIAGFYFGSSIGSKTKQTELDKQKENDKDNL
jgi:predicted transporter